MRLRLSVLSWLPLTLLAGCGSEEAVRDTFRENSIQGCLTASRQSAPSALAGVDWQRLCTCSTDKIMAGKSPSELAQLTPGGPGQSDAVQQCVTEMQRDGAFPGMPKQG
ncbi:MAG: hypothetical protein ACXWUN_07415 [Allosphingosinicella sp.]